MGKSERLTKIRKTETTPTATYFECSWSDGNGERGQHPRERPVMTELIWRRGEPGTSIQGQPLAYFNDEYGFAIFPEIGGRGWDLCWAAPDEGYEMLEPGLTVADAKACAARMVAKGRVSHVG